VLTLQTYAMILKQKEVTVVVTETDSTQYVITHNTDCVTAN